MLCPAGSSDGTKESKGDLFTLCVWDPSLTDKGLM